MIQRELEQIKIKKALLQMNDCKLLMDNVNEVKVLCDPCEISLFLLQIRVKRMLREWKDLRHLFYYLPNYFREMALIGKESEIKQAENRIDQFFTAKRDINYANNQQISFLLPIYFKNLSSEMKLQLNTKCSKVQSQFIIFFYEPTYPRKHLTVLMIGPRSALLQAKIVLEELANVYMFRNNHSFMNFQQFTYHQQIRFSFKSLKRFVLEKDIKYLNHWDLCSIFMENAGKPVQNFDWQTFLNQSQPSKGNISQMIMISSQQDSLQPEISNQSFGQSSSQNLLFHHQQVANQQQIELLMKQREDKRSKDYSALIDFLKNQDIETCINSIFVLNDSSNAEESLRELITRLKVSKNELIQFMAIMLNKNIGDFEDSIRSYGARYEPIKITQQEANNESETLIIQQSRDACRRPKGYYQTLSTNLQFQLFIKTTFYKKRSKSRSGSQLKYISGEHEYHPGFDQKSRGLSHDFSNENKKSKPKFSNFDNEQNMKQEKESSRSRSVSRIRSKNMKSSDSNENSSDSSSHGRYKYFSKNYKRNADSPDFTRPIQRFYKRSPTREYSGYHKFRYHGSYKDIEGSTYRKSHHSRDSPSKSRSRSYSKHKHHYIKSKFSRHYVKHSSRRRSSSSSSYHKKHSYHHDKSSGRKYYQSFYHGGTHYKYRDVDRASTRQEMNHDSNKRQDSSTSQNEHKSRKHYSHRSKSRETSHHRTSRSRHQNHHIYHKSSLSHHYSKSRRQDYHDFDFRHNFFSGGYDSQNYFSSNGSRDPYHSVRALQDPNRKKNSGGFDNNAANDSQQKDRQNSKYEYLIIYIWLAQVPVLIPYSFKQYQQFITEQISSYEVYQ